MNQWIQADDEKNKQKIIQMFNDVFTTNSKQIVIVNC